MKIRQLFIESMCDGIIENQNEGPINILVGKKNGIQRIIKAVFIVVSVAVDNDEAIKSQGKSFSPLCPSNCRLCLEDSDEFYKWSLFSDIILDENNNSLSNSEKLQLYNTSQKERYQLRNTTTEMEIAHKAENVFWKKILFNKDKMAPGYKVLKLPIHEVSLLKECKQLNLKPVSNNIIRNVLQPFFTRNGTSMENPIIQSDLLFAPDFLHTANLGFMKYTLNNGISCCYIYSSINRELYGRNFTLVDQLMINFDIYQPKSHWGYIVQRRLPGISGEY